MFSLNAVPFVFIHICSLLKKKSVHDDFFLSSCVLKADKIWVYLHYIYTVEDICPIE